MDGIMEEVVQSDALHKLLKDLLQEGGRYFLKIYSQAASGGEYTEALSKSLWLQESHIGRIEGLLHYDTLIELMQVQIAWEKLHTGNWKDVALAWREAYTLSCMMTATARLRALAVAEADPAVEETSAKAVLAQQGLTEECVSNETFNAAMRDLDLAVMMGGPALQKFAHQMIAHLASSDRLTEESKDNTANVSAAKGGGEDSEPASKKHRSSANPSQEHAALDCTLPPPGSGLPPGTSVEVIEAPSLESFWTEYMQAKLPVVISGALQHWPAMTRWREVRYLTKKAGRRTVPVEVGEHYLQEGWGQKLMLLSDFIATHLTQTEQGNVSGSDGASRAYLAQHPLFDQIPELKADFYEPEYCCLGQGEMQAVNAWFGPAGTVTPLHFDPHHNLLAQVVGTKYVRLYTPACSQQLAPYEEGHNTNSSQVDLDNPDSSKWPSFSSLPFKEHILQAGQMLYIPPKHWHYVKSLSVSFSVSFWWQ